MKLDNLLFANMNDLSYVPAQQINHNYADINTGDAFYQYYNGLIEKSKKAIVPLMIFADGIIMDKNGTMDVYFRYF